MGHLPSQPISPMIAASLVLRGYTVSYGTYERQSSSKFSRGDHRGLIGVGWYITLVESL